MFVTKTRRVQFHVSLCLYTHAHIYGGTHTLREEKPPKSLSVAIYQVQEVLLMVLNMFLRSNNN